MRKKQLTLAALMAATLPATAVVTDVVSVELLTGSAYSAAIADVTRVMFTDDTVSLVSADGIVIYSKPIAEVKRVAFGQGNPSSIADFQSPETEVRIIAESSSRSVRVEGLADGSPVLVYSLSSDMMIKGSAPSVDLSGLHAGLYVVVAGDVATRVTVK